MDTNSKNKFDALATLWKGAWENFNVRRQYEFKFTFALWTAFAAFISIIITSESETINHNYLIGTIIIGGLISLLHLWFIVGIGRAHNLDREIAIHYERKMQLLSDSEFPQELKTKITQSHKRMGKLLRNWSHFTQAIITILLYLGAILSIIYK